MVREVRLPIFSERVICSESRCSSANEALTWSDLIQKIVIIRNILIIGMPSGRRMRSRGKQGQVEGRRRKGEQDRKSVV